MRSLRPTVRQRRAPRWLGSGARCLAALALAALVALVSTGARAARPPVLLLVKVQGRPEACWWEQGARGRSGSTHELIAAALRRVGLQPMTPAATEVVPLAPSPVLPSGEALEVLAARHHARRVLAVDLRTHTLGRVDLLQLQGLEAQVSARLVELPSGEARTTLLSARAFEAELPVARQQALARGAERLASWARSVSPAAGVATPEDDSPTLHVRKVAKLAQLRALVLRLQSSGAGRFWLAGAQNGEALLATSSSIPSPAVIAAALEATPFEDFVASVHEEAGAVVIEIGPKLADSEDAPPPTDADAGPAEGTAPSGTLP